MTDTKDAALDALVAELIDTSHGVRLSRKSAGKPRTSDTCPICKSTAPHLHPAVQHEGEVEVCIDDFHLRDTPQNTDAIKRFVLMKRKVQQP